MRRDLPRSILDEIQPAVSGELIRLVDHHVTSEWKDGYLIVSRAQLATIVVNGLTLRGPNGDYRVDRRFRPRPQDDRPDLGDDSFAAVLSGAGHPLDYIVWAVADRHSQAHYDYCDALGQPRPAWSPEAPR